MADPDHHPLEEIRGQIAAGRKIEAIKLYRASTGLGLKEAKDAVEEMERELAGQPPETSPPTPDGNPLEQVRNEIAAGRKIEAIKLYRETTGLGLKEAKEAVEEMERVNPPTGSDSGVVRTEKGGCLPAIVVALVLGSFALAVSAWAS